MPQHRVDVDRVMAVPRDELFAHLAEHENLQTLFGLKVERVRDGDTERNGTGSVRRLSIFGAMPFDETVTGYEPGKSIEYRITRGGILRNHLGRMAFADAGEGLTRLGWTIDFDGPAPGVGAVVRAGLQRGIERGLDKIEGTR